MFSNSRIPTISILAFTLIGSTQTGCAQSVATPVRDALQPEVAHRAAISACTIEGRPRVIADKVAPAGVDAATDDSRVWLRLGERVHRPLVVALDPGSLDVVPGVWQAPGADAEEALLPTSWQQGSTDTSAARGNRSAVRVDGDRWLVAWTDGSVENGYQVRFATVSSRGDFLGGGEFKRDGSAISAPAASIGPSGRGVLAFIESNGRGFQLVAASLDCGAERSALAQAAP
jgi:hypothetical protein